MNDAQKWVAVSTVIIDMLMGLFPPWHINWSPSGGGIRQVNKGYHFILTPLPAETITLSTLFVQISVVTLAGAALFWFLKSRD